MNTEIESLFLAQYVPIVQKKQRLMGEDCLAIAFHIMDDLRAKGKSQEYLRDAASTMIYTFNGMLNPKMEESDMDDMIDGLVRGGMLMRGVASTTYDQLKQEGYI
jgi:hypothetical protein